MNNYPAITPARQYEKGMGEAVANRTVNRKIPKPVIPYKKTITLPRRDDVALDDLVAAYCKSEKLGISGYHVDEGDGEEVLISLSVTSEVQIETWEDVAERVATGSALLRLEDHEGEYRAMLHHLRQASILMSGRHLQHGDESQPSRNIEVFTNCSTAALTSLSFYLLLNGSGVGRAYDDIMMQVDWSLMPTVVCTIAQNHPDVQSGEIYALTREAALHLYKDKRIIEFKVPDSREGWAQAIEKLELMAFQGCHRSAVLLLEFSGVRHRGSPINGMQDRPASGPGPLMNAIMHVAKLRDAGMEPWRATMYADHYFAECVLVGGARRAARMATKSWRDKNIFGFIELKKEGFLWSSNNSVTVDQEFWDLVKQAWHFIVDNTSNTFFNVEALMTPEQQHAWKVFNEVCHASYYNGTGEPGFINVDKLTWSDDGLEDILTGDFAASSKYKLMDETKFLARAVAQAWSRSRYKVITNPCGEIVLGAVGGYCVIADVVPYHAGSSLTVQNLWTNEELANHYAAWDDDAEDAFRVATRALIRTNLMDAMYDKEIKRTNRIGVGMTGLHEYAWQRFGYGFRDIIDEEKSKDFWLMLARFKRAVQSEAEAYSKLLGVTVPHTDTTMKPAGTTSKLFGLTEGAHLPSMREYLRWVQFRNDDPLIAKYQAQGYPVKRLKSYEGTTVVGFPTAPAICGLGMGDKLVTAAEATMAEQYQYIRLLEKYWLTGVEEDGVTPLRETGNQISYTAKYSPEKTSYKEFQETLLFGQSTIRCCSVMPQGDTTAYEYQPEEPVTKTQYEMICNAIREDNELQEEVGLEHVDKCAGGACPIDFNTEKQ